MALNAADAVLVLDAVDVWVAVAVALDVSDALLVLDAVDVWVAVADAHDVPEAVLVPGALHLPCYARCPDHEWVACSVVSSGCLPVLYASLRIGSLECFGRSA